MKLALLSVLLLACQPWSEGRSPSATPAFAPGLAPACGWRGALSSRRPQRQPPRAQTPLFCLGGAAGAVLLQAARGCDGRPLRGAPGGAARLGRRSLLPLASGGAPPPTEPIMVGDIVEFSVQEEALCSVGFVEAEEQDESGQLCLRVMRLVRREGVGEECYLDESQPTLLLTPDSCRFVDSYPSQRVAWSTASPHHNPHGEESEDCWFLEGSLSEACVIPVKPISET